MKSEVKTRMTDAKQDWRRAQLELWAERAAIYSNLKWVNESDFLKAFLDFCPITSQSYVLDAGTGTGIVARALAQHAKKVIGIDISPEMIDTFRANSNPANLECHECDVQAMPFSSETFDLCTARMVFHHVENCMAGLKEILRVLKTGGHLALIEGVPPDHRTRARYEEIFRLKEKRHTFSEAELINMFHRAGFGNISLYPHFMKQVSLNNWLENSALSQDAIDEIRRLHVEADEYFKDAYHLTQVDDDVLMDWKFVILLGTK